MSNHEYRVDINIDAPDITIKTRGTWGTLLDGRRDFNDAEGLARRFGLDVDDGHPRSIVTNDGVIVGTIDLICRPTQ